MATWLCIISLSLPAALWGAWELVHARGMPREGMLGNSSLNFMLVRRMDGKYILVPYGRPREQYGDPIGSVTVQGYWRYRESGICEMRREATIMLAVMPLEHEARVWTGRQGRVDRDARLLVECVALNDRVADDVRWLLQAGRVYHEFVDGPATRRRTGALWMTGGLTWSAAWACVAAGAFVLRGLRAGRSTRPSDGRGTTHPS